MSSRASGELCCGDVGTLSPATKGNKYRIRPDDCDLPRPLEWSQTAPRAHPDQECGPSQHSRRMTAAVRMEMWGGLSHATARPPGPAHFGWPNRGS
jgi:hypothetical protein